MGLFKKKHDPLTERARALNDQITALEAQIRQLSVQPAAPTPPVAAPPAPAVAAPAAPVAPRPRLRSTAVPRGTKTLPVPAPAPEPPAPAQEPVFEEVDHARLQAQQEKATSGRFEELGVRRYDLAAFWRRIKNHFRGPATNNPKLVSYLAAGSVQGLRPMRYEKRVARNRFLLFFGVLALALWGLVKILWRQG